MLQSTGSQRVEHNLSTKQQQSIISAEKMKVLNEVTWKVFSGHNSLEGTIKPGLSNFLIPLHLHFR